MLLSLLSKRTLYDDSRDTYGFTVRPQHIQTYREYANIYKEEEGERLQKWKDFLKQQEESSIANPINEDNITPAVSEVTQQSSDPVQPVTEEGDDSTEQRLESSDDTEKKAEPLEKVSDERHDSSEQNGRSYDDTEKKSEPVEQVIGEGGNSSEQKNGGSDDTENKTEPVETVSEERADSSCEQNHGSADDVDKKTEPLEKVSEEGADSSEQNHGSSDETDKKTEPVEEVSEEGGDSSEKRPVSYIQEESVPTKEAPTTQHRKSRGVQTWSEISQSLNSIEHMMSVRIKRRKTMSAESIRDGHKDLPSIDEEISQSDNGCKDVLHDHETVDSANASEDKMSQETSFPWKKELELLVHGGVPKDLRGEVWQAFVGVRTRRVERYYQDLLATESDDRTQHEGKRYNVPEKLKKQIEKDLPRTFPGHPALNENGRNSLRRVLLAYAKHNPSVGYCQAMNFFAGLLLLMMPEENAFWTLVGIIDDYFEDYFSQEMTESQVDQLVFEDLMRERFPKLVTHLEFLGVEVAWISGPWFLTIFVNMLPWESVLRVWDVLLFEGNRVMLFRTALALMDLYGPALITTKDAGDAITLLQTLAGSTFDCSQLVLTACMGFLTITEDRLQELREKHRPSVVSAFQERAKGGRSFKDPKRLASKLYSFKHEPESIVKGDNTDIDEDLDSLSADLDGIFKGMPMDSEVDSLPDLQEQVVWLKVELCKLLEEKRSATLRAEELESAFMEIVKEDNRRELSARVEQLEQEVAELKQILADTKEGEKAMLQVLMKVEQEQKVTEDARLFAEQDAAAQKNEVKTLQEKYDQAMASLAQMEKRAVMAESMLEATLQYESGQSKALSSPRCVRQDSQKGEQPKRSLLSFGLGWRDRNKGKDESKTNEGSETDHQ